MPPTSVLGRAEHAPHSRGGGLCCALVQNLLAFLLLIGPLIFFHELGHLVVAKLLDVKAVRFSIGFGPPLLSKRIGETEYCLESRGGHRFAGARRLR